MTVGEESETIRSLKGETEEGKMRWLVYGLLATTYKSLISSSSRYFRFGKVFFCILREPP